MSSDQLPTLRPEAAAPAPVVTEPPRKRGRPPGSKSKAVCATEAAAIAGPCAPSGLVAKIAGEGMQSVHEADSLLRHIVEQQAGKPTIEQLAYFGSLGWNTDLAAYSNTRGQLSLKRELSRMSRVVRNLAIAGSAADREAMTADRIRADAELKARGQELQDAINRAQQELAALNHAATLALKRETEAAQAMANLREDVPLAIDKLFHQSRSIVNETLGQTFRDLDARYQELTVMSQQDYAAETVRFYTRRLPRDHAAHVPDGGRVDQTQWALHVEQLKAELAELTPQWHAAKAAYEAALEGCQSGLDYYL